MPVFLSEQESPDEVYIYTTYDNQVCVRCRKDKHVSFLISLDTWQKFCEAAEKSLTVKATYSTITKDNVDVNLVTGKKLTNEERRELIRWHNQDGTGVPPVRACVKVKLSNGKKSIMLWPASFKSAVAETLKFKNKRK